MTKLIVMGVKLPTGIRWHDNILGLEEINVATWCYNISHHSSSSPSAKPYGKTEISTTWNIVYLFYFFQGTIKVLLSSSIKSIFSYIF